MLKIYKILDRLELTIKVIMVGALAVMIFSASMQVLGRYILVVPLPWTEELARRMMTWLLFSASAIGYRAGGMIGIDLIPNLLPEKIKKVVNVFVYCLVACFGIFMMWQGYQLASRMNTQFSTALGMPMTYVYMIIPLSGFLFFIFSIELIVKRLTGYKKEE